MIVRIHICVLTPLCTDNCLRILGTESCEQHGIRNINVSVCVDISRINRAACCMHHQHGKEDGSTEQKRYQRAV